MIHCPFCSGEGCPDCFSLGAYNPDELIPLHKDSPDIYVVRGFIDEDGVHRFTDGEINKDVK